MSDFMLSGQLNISVSECDTLLSLGSGPAALVYLYMLRNNGRRPGDADMRAMNLTGLQTGEAISLLETAGLITSAKHPSGLQNDSRPTYRADEIAGGIRRDASFAWVVGETEKLLGKVLSSSDMQTLYAIFDWRGLPPAVILMLAHYCADDIRRAYGEGARPPTMKQIDREAASWERAGIFTMDAAEEHIKLLEYKRGALAKTQKLLGISGRSLTPTENKYIDGWLSAGLSPELIGLAYDKTVVNTGKMTWKYCDAILQSWASKGVKEPEDIDSLDGKKKQTASGSARRGPGLNPDKPFVPGSRELDSVAKIRELIQQREKK